LSRLKRSRPAKSGIESGICGFWTEKSENGHWAYIEKVASVSPHHPKSKKFGEAALKLSKMVVSKVI
jgi:hypothetical protein